MGNREQGLFGGESPLGICYRAAGGARCPVKPGQGHYELSLYGYGALLKGTRVKNTPRALGKSIAGSIAPPPVRWPGGELLIDCFR